ncbi:MAG TPA: hypothetical protein VF384_17190 [Planctomycetota bacterium]
MKELLQVAVPYLPVTLLAMTLLLLSPNVGEVGRRRIALLFGLGAICLIGLSFSKAGAPPSTLDVVNPFPMGPDMKSTPVHIETVTAPGWQWPLACACFCGLVMLIVFGTVRLGFRAPKPASYCAFIATVFAAMRLVLEKNAAPQGLVWATGGSIGLPILVGFVGYYSGGRKHGFGQFVLTLVLFALLQRAALSGIAWFATMRHWGTHLDVNALTQLNTPIGGERTFGADPTDKWVWGILVPQMGLWVVATVALGLVIGTVGWLFGRRARG